VVDCALGQELSRNKPWSKYPMLARPSNHFSAARTLAPRYYWQLFPSLFESPIVVSLRVEKPISNINRLNQLNQRQATILCRLFVGLANGKRIGPGEKMRELPSSMSPAFHSCRAVFGNIRLLSYWPLMRSGEWANDQVGSKSSKALNI